MTHAGPYVRKRLFFKVFHSINMHRVMLANYYVIDWTYNTII